MVSSFTKFSHSACCSVSHYYRVRSRQFVSKYTYVQGLFKLGLCSSFFTGLYQLIKLSIVFNFDSGDVLGVASKSPCALEAFLESFLEFLLVNVYSYCICGATHTIQVKIQVHNFQPQFMATSLNSSNSS